MMYNLYEAFNELDKLYESENVDYKAAYLKLDKFMDCDDPKCLDKFYEIRDKKELADFIKTHMVDEARFYSYAGEAATIDDFANYILTARETEDGKSLNEDLEFSTEEIDGAIEITGEINSISVRELYDAILHMTYDYEDGDYMDMDISFAKTGALKTVLDELVTDEEYSSTLDEYEETSSGYYIEGDSDLILRCLDALISVDENLALTNVDIAARSLAVDDEYDEDDDEDEDYDESLNENKSYTCNDPSMYGNDYSIEGPDAEVDKLLERAGVTVSGNSISEAQYDQVSKYIYNHTVDSYTYRDSYRGDDTIITVDGYDASTNDEFEFYVKKSMWSNLQGKTRVSLTIVNRATAERLFNTKKDIDFGWT